MEGIHELFAEYSEPDPFHYQAQLELFVWHAKAPQRRHAATAGRRMYMRKWIATYTKRRRASDPEWAANQRTRQNRLNREYRARKKAAGKCARCPLLRVDGMSLCQSHLEYDRRRMAKRAA
jgi:hypothetical protein